MKGQAEGQGAASGSPLWERRWTPHHRFPRDLAQPVSLRGIPAGTLQRYRAGVTTVPDDPEWNMGRASAGRADAEQCEAARRRVRDRARQG